MTTTVAILLTSEIRAKYIERIEKMIKLYQDSEVAERKRYIQTYKEAGFWIKYFLMVSPKMHEDNNAWRRCAFSPIWSLETFLKLFKSEDVHTVNLSARDYQWISGQS